MKKILVLAAAAALALAVATPAVAGHPVYYRGHSPTIYRHRHVHHYARPRTFLSFSVGFPFYGYAAYYRPAPVYYEPYPVVVEPPYCHPIWIPGHYAWDDGARFYVQGHWSRDED